ncbi:hypothetical protein [Halocella sp. SP3-1]|uniref:hypothetical protein n=1 Tax=Halocella sp. SP3-1 TaxID=2382161 RepID=UPI000F7EACF6|nr:hypothetical protein [Halocella sp. SP3-1]
MRRTVLKLPKSEHGKSGRNHLVTEKGMLQLYGYTKPYIYSLILDMIEEMGEEGFAEKIVDLAYSSWTDSTDGVVFFDYETKKLDSAPMSNGDHFDEDNAFVELYRLKQNWLARSTPKKEDILTTEEQAELIEKYEEPDYLDEKQLASIDIDLGERMKNYLVYLLTDKGGMDDILERLKG